MRSVLVIDDDDLVRGMIVMALRRAGYDVTEARDGEQGIRVCEQSSPEIVVTDIFMPHQDGIDVLRRVKSAAGPKPKVLAISGGSPRMRGVDYLEVARRLGADGIVHKPFTPDALVAAIEKAAVEPAEV